MRTGTLDILVSTACASVFTLFAPLDSRREARFAFATVAALVVTPLKRELVPQASDVEGRMGCAPASLTFVNTRIITMLIFGRDEHTMMMMMFFINLWDYTLGMA